MSRANAPPRWQAELALAFVALVWGSTFVVVKSALTDISTVYFLALRFSLAAFCMLLMFWPSFRSSNGAAIRKGLAGGGIAGIFLWLGYVLQTFGLKYTTAGKSGFITGFYIALVPLLGAALYRRWPPARELLGIAVATAGIAILTLPRGNRFVMNRGDLLTIGCAIAFAIHLLVLGYYSQRCLVSAVALGQIACSAVLSTISLAWERPSAIWNRNVLFALTLTAIFATALAFAIQTWGQKYTSPSRTALIFALEPVFALATAVSVGREALTAAALAGGALVLAGILLVELKPKPRTQLEQVEN
ncbi:MAG TPA: DMT family transporter [Bryobacteraceae bacterium]|jgi:drug/metabolite transporter (DMT)-like permease|nr:DMT family transporter [Bryobacteraceae bacterium]